MAVSYFHGNDVNNVSKKDEKDVWKPDMMVQYNQFMKRTGKCDQYLNYSFDVSTVVETSFVQDK